VFLTSHFIIKVELLQASKHLRETSHNSIFAILNLKLKEMIAVVLVGVAVTYIMCYDIITIATELIRTGSAESILTSRSPIQCELRSCDHPATPLSFCRQCQGGTKTWSSKVKQFGKFADNLSCSENDRG